MKRTAFFTSLIIAVLLLSAWKPSLDHKTISTILIDAEYLSKTKQRIAANDPALKEAFERLIKEADRALSKGPYSVTDKEVLPPSGDKHDYASYSRYWWPDPEKEDGLPYIRRDGETNPDSQSKLKSDRPRIGALGKNTEALGLAYYLTGDQKYAKKAAELIRSWFLNEETRMKPNLNHAQCRPGHNNGSKSGVLDGRMMICALEGSLLIKGSSELSSDDYEGLKTWAKAYFKWLTTNSMALKEAKSKNNHGSYYDVQAIYFALYTGNEAAAQSIAQTFTENRILTQIKADGSMPEEMARTRPLFYSIYNLHALFMVAHLAEQVDVDIWQANDNQSRLRAALDYLAPYADQQKLWPQPTLGNANRMELYGILKMAHHNYPDGNYIKMIDKLPSEACKIQRENIAFPIMR